VERQTLPKSLVRYMSGLPPVCTENSSPDVMMVKPAEDGV
jgi:hypothetical protein